MDKAKMVQFWCLVVPLFLSLTDTQKRVTGARVGDEIILKASLGAQEKALVEAEEKRQGRRTAGKVEDVHDSPLSLDLEQHREDQMSIQTKRIKRQSSLVRSEVAQQAKQETKCNDDPSCDNTARFQNLDGTCNNLNNPLLGSARTAFVRLPGAEPDYADGVSIPRKAQDGSELPNARHLSVELFINVNRPSTKMTHMAMTWGQYLDHDITHAAGQAINCRLTCNNLTEECVGIPIPVDDPHFPNVGVSCIAVTRDAPADPAGLAIPREHINVLTSFIDASSVYSVDRNTSYELRDTTQGQGLLKETPHPSGSLFHGLLPTTTNGFCRTSDQVNQPCFMAGDTRANINPGLTSMHLIAVREHNRIAKVLEAINQHWNEETLFQETRKIVAAMHQHITYNEYLPEILDQSYIDEFGLRLENEGFYGGYNNSIDASIANSFSAAAFRFGHSQIRGLMSRYGERYLTRHTPVRTNDFFDPAPIYDVSQGGVDGLIRGLVKDPSQMVDGSFSKAVQEHLIRGPGDRSDLPAVNIQRGRERGLPGYNTFRSLSGLQWANSFDSFKAEIPSADVDKMAEVYQHPDDVDLYVGGILESHVGTGALGPTFSSLIAEQFQRLRSGDRFWYENDSEVGFTADQLTELRKVSLARLLCDNSDDITQIPRMALSAESAEVDCSSLPSMDLNKWKVDE